MYLSQYFCSHDADSIVFYFYKSDNYQEKRRFLSSPFQSKTLMSYICQKNILTWINNFMIMYAQKLPKMTK